MCPLCISGAVLMFAGTASAGGLTAFALRKLRPKARTLEDIKRDEAKESP